MSQIRYTVYRKDSEWWCTTACDGKVAFLSREESHANWLADTLNGLMELTPLFLDPDMRHAEVRLQETAVKFVSASHEPDMAKQLQTKYVSTLLLQLVRRCREMLSFKG